MCTDPVYMNCHQMVDLACGDDTEPQLKQSMLHCFLNIVIERLNLNSQSIELQPNQNNPIYDKFLYNLKPCPIKILNINDFKKIKNDVKSCNQTEEIKPKKCQCNVNDLYKLPEIDSECVCELMERVRIQECELQQLTERLAKFILEFRRKLPRKSQEIRDTTNDCLCDGIECDCDKKCKCGAEECDCVIEPSTSSDNVSPSSPCYSRKKAGGVDKNDNKDKNNIDCHISISNIECQIESSIKEITDIFFDREDGKECNIPKACRKLCDPVSNVACKLLMDPEFMKEILQRVSRPIIDKILTFQDQVYLLNKEFLKFICKANNEYEKRPSIADCMDEISKIHKLLKDKDKELLYTLEEIQDMLDAKLDKWHIPALKKYIRDIIERVENDIIEIKAIQDCPKGAATIIKNALCVCCNQAVCQKKITTQIPILPQLQSTPLPKFMGKKGEAPSKCNPIERFCGGSHTTIQPTERLFKASNLVDQFGKGKVLPEKVIFGKGFDGQIYRCEPPRPVCTCYENLMNNKKSPCDKKNNDIGDTKDTKCNQIGNKPNIKNDADTNKEK